jgi:predicted 3-demethylubiquinone-9 3-methyltransferase (glyoxalase superfamily)
MLTLIIKVRYALINLMKKRTKMPKITPFLWFDGKAEEAARFYTSIFQNSEIESVSPMSATFQLDGQRFIALNGGPQYTFTEAVSFFVRCETQQEIDYFGGNSPLAAKKGAAAGSRTSSECRGKSSLQF